MNVHHETPTTQSLRRRNRELGVLLAQARQQQNRSISDCATVLETSRRRYNAIERGDTAISVAELELLMTYLHIPINRVWGNIRAEQDAQHVVLQAQPGETIQLLVKVQD